MAFFIVILLSFIGTGLIAGGFIAAEARMCGNVRDLVGGAFRGLGIALVLAIMLFGVGSCTCLLLPPGTDGYAYTAEYELVQAEFDTRRCDIWYNDENDAVEKASAKCENTHVTREEGSSPKVTLTRTYDENSGLIRVDADITVPPDFTFEGEPDE